MSKATEVMMQYVENLKRTYEKDHAELTEFKKLANQNSNRSYGGSVETGGEEGPEAVCRPSYLVINLTISRLISESGNHLYFLSLPEQMTALLGRQDQCRSRLER